MRSNCTAEDLDSRKWGSLTRFIVLLIAILLCSISATNAESSPLTIRVDDRLPAVAVIGQPVIYMEGEIEPSSASRLEDLLEADSRLQGTTLYLHSPGGDLAAGISLGRVIRRFQLSTGIGRYSSDAFEFLPGECFSACAYAYFGGVSRYFSDTDEFGIHQFYDPSGNDTGSISQTQRVSAFLIEYLKEMEVSESIFVLAALAGPSEMISFSRKEMLDYGLANDGRFDITAEYRLQDNRPYLAIEQSFGWGTGKLLLMCSDDRQSVVFMSMMNLGGTVSQRVLDTSLNTYLNIDSDVIWKAALPNELTVVSEESLVTLPGFDSTILEQLAGARTFGFWLDHQNKIHRRGFQVRLGSISSKLEDFADNCSP